MPDNDDYLLLLWGDTDLHPGSNLLLENGVDAILLEP